MLLLTERRSTFSPKNFFVLLSIMHVFTQMTVLKTTLVICLLQTCIFVFWSFNTIIGENKIKGKEYLCSLAREQESLGKYCACKHCINQPNISEWFDKNFDPSIHPLLSEKNCNLSSEALAWWKHLQPYKGAPPFTVVMRRVFSLFPGEEQLVDRGRRRCRSCAVVANSNNLLGSSYGSQIDDHDFVMRMNQARTKGYEKDVGQRTTHHFLYPESAIGLDNDTALVLIPFKIRDFEWLMSVVTDGSIRFTYRAIPARIKFDRQKVLFYNPAFLTYVQKRWIKSQRYPSTGMLVLMFALHVCDELSVYGFGSDSQGQWKHYWENVSGTSHLSVHSANEESNILKKLHEIGKVRLSTGKKDLPF